MQLTADARQTDRYERYRGRNLMVLLIAIGTPALVLYLRVVLAYVAQKGQLPPRQVDWLIRASNFDIFLFCAAQLICAAYVQRLLKRRRSTAGRVLQYIGVLALCCFLSVTGAIMLEGFGYAFFLRVRG